MKRDFLGSGARPVGKQSKMKRKHVPAIERALPMERIIEVFEERFDDPYLNPMAELSFKELTTAFPNVPEEELEEGLSHWTNHSGEKTLSTKTVELAESTYRSIRVSQIQSILEIARNKP